MSVQFELDVPSEPVALVILVDEAPFFPWLAQFFGEQQFATCRSGGKDVRAAIEYAQREVKLPAFLLGHARGANLAISSASAVHDLRGIIAWSVPTDAASLAAASRLSVPLLAIQGEEEAVSSSDADAVAKAVRNGIQMVIRTDVARGLELAAAVTARFVAAYAES